MAKYFQEKIEKNAVFNILSLKTGHLDVEWGAQDHLQAGAHTTICGAHDGRTDTQTTAQGTHIII